MSTLTPLSEYHLPKFSVKQAAELTGLTLNQVRLWERRYKLVAPQRASNGYRLYSQEDLDVLRYARRETQKGISIQILADQVRQDRTAVLKLLREEKRITPRKIFASDPRRLPNYDLMIHAVANGDALKFEHLLIQAQAGKNFADAIRTVDLPILARIGELTTRNEVNIAGSHLASAIIRRRILAHVQNLGTPQNSQPVILACAPNDYHELGLLCCLLELTQQLRSTLYLGPNVPLKELEHYTQKLNPAAILISIIAPLTTETLADMTKELIALNQKVPIGLGGYEAEKQRSFFEAQGLQCFKGVEDIIEWKALTGRA